MTGKERAAQRAKANPLEPLFQIGKGGVTESVIAQTEMAYNTKELIKIKVLLETSPITPREAAVILAEKTNSEIIQVIGGVIVLYRENDELRKKEKEAKKRAAAVSAAKTKEKKTFYKNDVRKPNAKKGAPRSFSNKKSKGR